MIMMTIIIITPVLDPLELVSSSSGSDAVDIFEDAVLTFSLSASVSRNICNRRELI